MDSTAFVDFPLRSASCRTDKPSTSLPSTNLRRSGASWANAAHLARLFGTQRRLIWCGPAFEGASLLALSQIRIDGSLHGSPSKMKRDLIARNADHPALRCSPLRIEALGRLDRAEPDRLIEFLR